MDRKQLQKLSIIRLAEAKSLLRAKYWDGAYYLAGYSVECGLKACIAKQIRRFDFPDKKNVDASHTHDLKALVRIANLEPLRLKEAKSDSAFHNNWIWFSNGPSKVATAAIRPWTRQHWWMRWLAHLMEY